MSATIIDGKAVSADVRARVAAAVAAELDSLGRPPALATVLVGSDPASHVYVANKRKACEQAGIRSIHHELAADVDPGGLIELVLTDVSRQLVVERTDPGRLAGLALVGDVNV